MTPELYLPARLSTRSAAERDVEDIKEFLNEMLGEFELDLDHYGTDSDIEEIPGSYERGYFGIIEENGQIMGTFALFPLDETSAEVRKMYLSPALRGKGLGRQMLKVVESIAHEKGFDNLELQTASAMSAARQLYISAGFVEIEATGKTDRCDRKYVKKLKPQEV